MTAPDDDARLNAPASPGSVAGSAESSLALTVLHEVLLSLAHDTSTEAVFALLAEKARLLTGSASATVALLESDREFLTFVAASGTETAELIGTKVFAGDSLLGNTARMGETHLTFRPDGESVTGGIGTGPSVVSAAVVPFFEGGQPVGAFAALNKENRQPFTGSDVMALTTLATAASVALVNSRRRSESQRQSRELSVLYEAVRNISGYLSTQEVLRALVTQATAHLEAAAVVVYLLNDERTHLYIAEEHGLTTEQRERTLPADSEVGTAVLSSPRTQFLTLRDPDEDTLTTSPVLGRAISSPFPELPARTGLVSPLRNGDAVHGLILLLSGQGPGAYTLADANLLNALATQAAIAIDGAYLYEDTSRRAEEAAALYELSQTVTSTLQLGDVLERVADSVISLLSVDKFALFLYDRRTERLQLVIERGLEPGAAERLTPAVGEGIPGWVMEFETPTAVRDVAADHRNASAPLHPEGIISLACTPLQVGSSTIGVLCAMTNRRRLFTVAEMELLYTIANQAAIAIENARIYADVRQKSRELRKYFHRVARALGSSQEPRAVPHLIASLTLEVMGADRCALYAVQDAPAPGETELLLVARAGFRLAYEPENSSSTVMLANPDSVPPIHLPYTDSIPGSHVARRGKSLVVDDLNEETRYDRVYIRPSRGKIGSYLGVPLRSGTRVIGVLEIFTRNFRRWRGDEVRLLLTFASQATVALQSARLAQERAEASQDRDLLQKLMALVQAPILNLETEVLKSISERLGETVNGSTKDGIFKVVLPERVARTPFWETVESFLSRSITENRNTNGS